MTDGARLIFQCPACRELARVDRALVADDGDRVGLLCSACHETAWLPVEANAAAASPARSAPPPTRAGPPPAAAAPASDPELEALLRAVPLEGPGARTLADELIALVPRWTDFEAHRALIRRALAAESLPVLGVRYRKVQQARPGDEVAQRATQEILTLAMATLDSMAPSAPADTGRRAQIYVSAAFVALFLLAAAGFLVYVLRAL